MFNGTAAVDVVAAMGREIDSAKSLVEPNQHNRTLSSAMRM
jgi:hypothetical protein